VAIIPNFRRPAAHNQFLHHAPSQRYSGHDADNGKGLAQAIVELVEERRKYWHLLQYLDGQKLTEGLLNYIEVAIRAFDPCLSCATHAVGKMPLEVELVDAGGNIIDRLNKNSDGRCAA